MSSNPTAKPLSKPLKGSAPGVGDGIFDSISAGALNVDGIFEDGTIINVIVEDSAINNTVIGVGGPSIGVFTEITDYGNLTLLGQQPGELVYWDFIQGIFNINAELKVSGCSLLGNLDICNNTIQAVNSNGDVQIIPNGFGTLVLQGPITNIASFGNFTSFMQTGSTSLRARDAFTIRSDREGATIASHKAQLYTTTNGDITFSTEPVLTSKNITNVISTQGNVRVTTQTNHNILVNDAITLAGVNSIPSFNGTFSVLSVLSPTTFLIDTTTDIFSSGTTGTLLKTPSNVINLNASTAVKIPQSIPLVLGASNITSVTQGLLVNASEIVLNAANIHVPQFTQVNIGSAGTLAGSTSLVITGNQSVTLAAPLAQINATNTVFSDPILTVGDYVSSALDLKDRGIEFKYTNTSGQKLGWFGYKKSLDAFTFIPDAVNNGEIISGSFGNIAYASLLVTDAVISGGNLNLACGDIINVSRLVGCTNLSIEATGNVTIQSNRTFLESTDINIPQNIPLRLGTSSLSGNATSMTLVTSNMYMSVSSVNIPEAAPIVSGSTSIKASNGTLQISATTIALSSGTTLVNDSAKMYFGSSSFITGNTSLNIVAPTVSIQSVNDTVLSSSAGVVRVTAPLTFATSGALNSISVSNGALVVSGAATNDLVIKQFQNVHVPNVVFTTGTSIHLSSGALVIYAPNTSIVMATSGITISAPTTRISSGAVSVYGSDTLLGAIDTRISDPNVTLNAQSQNTDTGIEYNTPSSMAWAGYKASSGEFAFYSTAINTNNVITGTLGTIRTGSILTNSVVFNTQANIDLQCGTLGGVRTITSCVSGLDILSSTVHISSANIILNSDTINIPSTSIVQFGTNTIQSNTGTLQFESEKVIITGDLQVNGTTTNVYSTVTNIQDPIISIGGVIGPIIDDQKDRGIEFKWYDGTGFFGFKDATERFVFIKQGTNTNEVFSGAYSDVQFGDAYIDNLHLEGGISGSDLTISASVGVSILTPGDIVLGANNVVIQNALTFGTNGSILLDSIGTLVVSNPVISFDTDTVLLNEARLEFCQDSSIYCSSGRLVIDSLQTSVQGGLDIPINTFLEFGSTTTSILSDGTNLFLYGQSVNLDTPTTNITGDLIVDGTLSAANFELDIDKYILPLGTDYRINIVSIVNATAGLLVTTDAPHYLIVNDTLTITQTDSVPKANGDYTVVSVVTPYSFIIPGTIVTPASRGIVISPLKFFQGKDVGIQVNFWSTSGNPATSGSINYKTGFFGFKNDTERWTFYKEATIANNIVTQGILGDVQCNAANVNRISGYILDGPITAGNQAITGTNFKINGGNVDATPVGSTTASTGRFTTLTNTVSATFLTARMNSTLTYTPERYTVTSIAPTRNPNTSNIVSFISVAGVSFTGTGTMPVTGMNDGQLKILVCSSLGTNCKYELAFPPDKLMTPNPLSAAPPTKIVFKRAGQSIHMIWDNTGAFWIPVSSGVYAE
jgi:hypothetical protein